jgi:hypothetical protein
LYQSLLQSGNDANPPALFEQLHRQPLKPTLANPMQPHHLPVRLRKPDPAAWPHFLREKRQTNLQLLNAMELERKTANPDKINWITL